MIRVNVKQVNGKTQYIIMLPKGSLVHKNEDDDAWLDNLTEEQLQQLYEAENENNGRELPEMSEDEDDPLMHELM